MSRKHKPKKEPYVRTARDARFGMHKYYKIDEAHSMAVPGGRCVKCRKITDCFCDKCSSWCCKEHLEKKGENELCACCARDSDNLSP